MVSASELKKICDSRGEAVLVDVRTPSEYAAGHVPRAVNVSMEEIESRLEDLNPHSSIVLICQSGGRARLAAALLQAHRRDVTVLDGGTNEWVHAGFPLVVSAKTRWALERQVRLIAGLLVLLGSILAVGVNPHWVYLPWLVGLGLAFAAITDICPMASLLCKAPWNRRKLRYAAVDVSGRTCSLKNVPPAQPEG
jgi:rhodanese-related sulfurtransferase